MIHRFLTVLLAILVANPGCCCAFTLEDEQNPRICCGNASNSCEDSENETEGECCCPKKWNIKAESETRLKKSPVRSSLFTHQSLIPKRLHLDSISECWQGVIPWPPGRVLAPEVKARLALECSYLL